LSTVRANPPGRTRLGPGSINGVPVAYLAIWAAIYAVAAILPAIPLIGGGTFGAQEFILVIAGMIFGPIAGLVAAVVGGIIASLIAPATAYFGLGTFVSPAIGALCAGLLMKNTLWSRAVVLAIFVVMFIAWPLFPATSAIGSYVYSHWALFPMDLTALIGIAISPWAVRQIKTFDPKRVWIGVAIIGWTAYMVNHLAISLGYSFLYPEGPQQWVFSWTSGAVPLQRIALTVVATIVGTALIVGLHRAGIRFGPESGSALAEEPETDSALA
jgi:hypothetical protein